MVESGEGLGQIFLEHLIEYTVLALEIIITIIIIIIVGITLAHLLKIMLSKLRKKEEKEQRREYVGQLVRHMLRGLLISLDFLVAADLLKSILVPTVPELTTLAIIVAIRIVLSWSLSKEIESHTTQKSVL
jgi:uncharacterized membrane protein